ncbi:MAG: PAS domain-containing protein [Tildeniella nuda ZEHNDER 1965/U140]|jgi:PAS domain S-box-containing protein|nr:PAS domain-containing protein [Tildeniella nuda ZEHNDER 1965/U140]
MVSTFWDVPGIRSHGSLEFLERSLGPICVYNDRGETLYASQRFLELLQTVTEAVDFFTCFRSKSTSQALLENLWGLALQGKAVNFVAKTRDDGKSLECSLKFNAEANAVFLTAQAIKSDDKLHQPVDQPLIEAYERSFTLFHPSLATALINQAGVIMRCNQRLHELLNTTKHESLCLEDLVCPDDRLIDADLKQQLLDGAIDSYTVEKRFIAKDNDIIWMNLRVSLTRLDDCTDRHQCCFAVSLEDITESRKVYNALVRTEEKWKAFVLNSPYLFIQTSHTGQIVYISTAVERLLGYGEEELRGRHVTELLHPNHFNEFELVLQLWLSGVQANQPAIECWWRTKSGRWVALSLQGQSVPSALKFDGVVLSGHDITDRKCLEMELKTSEERFRSLVLNVPGAVFRCNATYTMVFVNDGIEAITGYPAAALLHNQSQSFLSIVHPDDITLIRDSLVQSVLDRHRCSVEYRIIHASGQVRWVLERKQGVFDQNGDLLWLDGVLLDISDRKQAEAALHQLKHTHYFEDKLYS